MFMLLYTLLYIALSTHEECRLRHILWNLGLCLLMLCVPYASPCQPNATCLCRSLGKQGPVMHSQRMQGLLQGCDAGVLPWPSLR